MNVRPSQITTIAFAPSATALVRPLEQPLADVPTQGVHRRVVDDDERDVAVGVSRRTDSVRAVTPPVKQPTCGTLQAGCHRSTGGSARSVSESVSTCDGRHVDVDVAVVIGVRHGEERHERNGGDDDRP